MKTSNIIGLCFLFLVGKVVFLIFVVYFRGFRRKAALEDIAVRPITHFPVVLAEETPEEKYANYPNVRVVGIKKVSY